ncbi:MAG: hypothetical protein O2821_12730 [Chloroflexi bacterium]|nr:hypothetical protein [Chloroflexota bacterium]
MKIHQMMQLIADWDGEVEPDAAEYFNQYDRRAFTAMTETMDHDQLGGFMAGFGMFANLVRHYGIPDDLNALFPGIETESH